MGKFIYTLFIITGFLQIHLSAQNGCPGDTLTSQAYYSFDDCEAYVLAGTVRDYSEFTSTFINPDSCASVLPLGTVHRINPDVNQHSCTPGVDGDKAMCISGLDSCLYLVDNEKALRFEILVTPQDEGNTILSSLSFFEQAPEDFFWIDGPAGINNYPTLYALRILKNGTEIYIAENVPTEQSWNLETYSFWNNEDFIVENNTVFSFEILPYCLIGNDSEVAAWDIDELYIDISCVAEPMQPVSICFEDQVKDLEICARDGISDILEIDISYTGQDATQIILTDENGVIVSLPNNNEIDFEGYTAEYTYVYLISYRSQVLNLELGNQLNSLEGCYYLSNRLSVRNSNIASETITAFNGSNYASYCINDNPSFTVDVSVSSSVQLESSWVITDANGFITHIPSGPPFVFNSQSNDICLIWHISHDDNFQTLFVGQNVYSLSGCYGLSNSITVVKEFAEGGVISIDGQTEVEVCVDSGESLIYLSPSLTGNSGMGSLWVLTDALGNIIEFNPSFPLDLGNYSEDECYLWHLAFQGNVSGLLPGNNVSNVSGCVDFSNSIRLSKTYIDEPVISYNGSNQVLLCNSPGEWTSFNPVIELSEELNLTWVITDGNDIVLSSSNSLPLNLSDHVPGTCKIYAVNQETSLLFNQGVSLFEVLMNECATISNSITVEKYNTSEGTLSSNSLTERFVCISGNSGGEIAFEWETSTTSNESVYIVTDDQGNIVYTDQSSVISFNTLSSSSYYVYHVDYVGALSGLITGGKITDINGCYSVSNSVKINLSVTNGGVVSTMTGMNAVSICTNDNSDLNVYFNVVNSEGSNNQWLVTDESGNIILLPDSNPVDFSVVGQGFYYVYNLNYNGTVNGLAIGNALVNLDGDCFDISNSVTVDINSVDGGTITSSHGDVIQVCAGDGQQDMVYFHVEGSVGLSTIWLLTDLNGKIIKFLPNPPFNVDDSTPGECLIWHLSFSNNIMGLLPGNNINDVQGCVDFSNSIRIIKTVYDTPVLTSDRGVDIVNCISESGVIPVLFSVSNSNGINGSYLIVDSNNDIIWTGSAVPMDLTVFGDAFRVFFVSYGSDFAGLEIGNSLNDLEGCYGLSNSVNVQNLNPEGGVLTSTKGDTIVICLNDIDTNVDIQLTGEEGAEFGWLITDENGVILSDLLTDLPLTYEAYGRPDLQVNHVSYFDELENVQVGNNIEDVDGCYDFSNSIVIQLVEVDAGELTSNFGNDISICVNDGSPDIISFELTGNSGFSQLVVTQMNGTILSLHDNYDIDFDSGNIGNCLVRNVSFLDDATALVVGGNIEDLEGCVDVSNFVIVRKTIKDAGAISVGGNTELVICFEEASLYFLTPEKTGGSSNGTSGWLISNGNGEILSIQNSLPLKIENGNARECFVHFICYDSSTENLAVGNNISDLMGCYDLSNAITLTKSDYVSPEISQSGLYLSFDNCYADTKDDSNMDYSEFIPEVDNDGSCVTYSLISNNFYRNSPDVNWHSCTDGQSNAAMCVSAEEICEYIPDSDRAIRFSLLLEPGAQDLGSIGKMSFYEQSPEQFDWINGPDGLNNYPQFYAVRIMKNGEEIYRETDIPTNPVWTLQEFDFTSLPEFSFDFPVVFDFEFLAYCIVDNGAEVMAWDMDEFNLYTECSKGLTENIITTVSGNNNIDLCLDDAGDNVVEFVVNKSGDQNNVFIITNNSGELLDTFTNTIYDFSQFTNYSELEVSLLSYSDDDFVDTLFDNFETSGYCYERSNVITINLFDIEDCPEERTGPGNHNLDDQSIVIDLMPNPVSDELRVEIEDIAGEGSQILIYNRMGELLQSHNCNCTSKKINISQLNDGFYILKVQSNNRVGARSFIKN